MEQKSALSAFFAASDRLIKSKTGDAEYADAMDDLFDKANDANTLTTACVKLYSTYSRGKINSMIIWETVISIVVIGLVALISWYITQGIVTPLARVVELAREISNGNLRANKLSETSRDELGQLAIAFNQMLDSLRDLSGQTASVTNNLNAAAAEILASTQQQAAGTKEQAATIQQITTTMEEVRQSGIQISDKAKQVATAAEASSTTTAAGLHAVQETNRTMEAIREQVEEVAEKIVALSEKTQAVGEIIATVNDIAERSNLLALNAAIEAAVQANKGIDFPWWRMKSRTSPIKRRNPRFKCVVFSGIFRRESTAR